MESPTPDELRGTKSRVQILIAGLAGAMILCHLLLRALPYGTGSVLGLSSSDLPLVTALLLGGVPLVLGLLLRMFRREFGSDLLAGISIVTSVLLGQYLAGTLVVLMLSGGEALEAYAVRSASSVLAALAQRMPSKAHRKVESRVIDVALAEVTVGETLVVFPHEICPVDGTVLEGHGVMDESYLTGEPYRRSKAPGTPVLSGAVNGDSALTIRADRPAADSRYAHIMRVMRASEQSRPRLRRLGDQLGAVYTPVAVTVALVAWLGSGDPLRFLAVLVIATPCPLLIAIPVAIIGSVSLAARRGIVIKDPAVLEKATTCRTATFDKTGTLTHGEPQLTALLPAKGGDRFEVLRLVAGLERYSKHPLAGAILEAAHKEGLLLPEVVAVSEEPGRGLSGSASGRTMCVTSRQKLLQQRPELEPELPPSTDGLECVVLLNDRYAATLRFAYAPFRGRPQ